MVVDALSRRHMSCDFLMLKEYESLQTLSEFDLTRDVGSSNVRLCSLVITPSLITRVVRAQNKDPNLASALEYLIYNIINTCPSRSPLCP